MAVLDSIFQAVGNRYLAAEALEDYVLAYEEAAYEDPGQQAPMGFMAL